MAASLRTNQSYTILQRNLFIPSCVPALWEPHFRPEEQNPLYRDLNIQRKVKQEGSQAYPFWLLIFEFITVAPK